MPITSGSSLETIRTRDALGGQRPHQLVDRVLGADVDAAGRLVHEDDAGVGGQPAGEDDLLLVAAGEELRLLVHRARRDVERGEQAGHLAAGGRRYGAGRRARTTPRALSRIVWLSARPVALRSSVIIARPARIACARGARAQRLAVEQHLAAGERADPEDRLEQLGAAGALQPGDADDLAGAQGEVDAVDVPVAGAAELEQRLAGLGAGRAGRGRTRRSAGRPSAGPARRRRARRRAGWRPGWPSLSTVIVSQRSKISLSRWET